MRERPILFSGEMVRAILDGRKTVTRRPVKPLPPKDNGTARVIFVVESSSAKRAGGFILEELFEGGSRFTERGRSRELWWGRCPLGSPGDRLWVRETWGTIDNGPDDYPYIIWRADRAVDWQDGLRRSGDIHYVASDTEPEKWRPSIHMPRWASRILLEVTSVRAERLQDITEEDATAEGVEPFKQGSHPYTLAFAVAWDSIYGPKELGWNPWVWRVEFRVVTR